MTDLTDERLTPEECERIDKFYALMMERDEARAEVSRLQERVRVLNALVESGYREGLNDGDEQATEREWGSRPRSDDRCWRESETFEALQQKEPE